MQIFMKIKFRKYEGNHQEIYRQFISFLRSWKKYTEHHEEAKLFLSLLTPQRNSRNAIKAFLKVRKCILKSLNQKILQQLFLTHEDILAITHTLFSQNLEIKSYITKKINELFISLKRKLINSAKVNGAVICQFFMACGQRFNQLNINNLFGQIKNQKKKIESNSSKRRQNIIPLSKRQLNIQNPEIQNKFFDNKYNLSFSEQFASYYSPPNTNQKSQQYFQKEMKYQYDKQNNILKKDDSKQQIWNIQRRQCEAPIQLVRNSLTFFKQKDKEIDQKLNHCKTFVQHQNRQKVSSNMTECQNLIYPQGWQDFIKMNEMTKRKLMQKNRREIIEESD